MEALVCRHRPVNDHLLIDQCHDLVLALDGKDLTIRSGKEQPSRSPRKQSGQAYSLATQWDNLLMDASCVGHLGHSQAFRR